MPDPGPPESGWTLTVDRSRCMGSGTCLTWCPGSIELDAEGKAMVRHPVSDGLDAARNAVEACPTEALALTDRGTGTGPGSGPGDRGPVP